nr:hypothetical protein [Coxiella-like endosymbiont]
MGLNWSFGPSWPDFSASAFVESMPGGLGQMVMLVRQGKKFELWGELQWELAREDWLAEELPREERGTAPRIKNNFFIK